MKIFKQLFIIFLLCLLGQLISSIIPSNFPPSVISMVLLLILLLAGVIKEENIKETANFLLANMAFFFIPAGVNIIGKYEFIKGHVFQLFIICLITTFLTFITTAITVTTAIKIMRKRGWM